MKNKMRPVHPGEILVEEYIKPLGISVRAVSIALHVPYSRLNEIVRGRRGVSADTALRFSRLFGGDAAEWLARQSEYDLQVAEALAGKRIAKEVDPRALTT